MRIALLADFPVHRLPGYERLPAGHHATWLPPLAQELESCSADLDFHWITCTKDVSRPVSLCHWSQTFHLLPRKKLSLEILTGFRRERYLIARQLSEIKPDLVHAWGTEQGYALAGGDFSGPSLLSLQGILQAYCRASSMPWLTRLQARHEATAFQQYQHLTVESPWGKDQLNNLAPHANIHFLEYAASPACFEMARKPAKKPLALFVGTLSRLKGVDTLLDAFSNSRLRHIDLEIFGAGSPRFTRRKLPPNINLRGYQSPQIVRQRMTEAWCLVHPTRADTSPNCVKEARVIGLPVVTTPNGGQTQYVMDGKSGFIHQVGDTEGLIRCVLKAFVNRQNSLTMGEAGQQESRNLLTPARTAHELLGVYHRIG